ncbi:S-adenosyl-L-methionine-dependent methyltransferase [Rhizophagus irregularis]|uniref:S-adenosyl-L-methionine-dependent methyltransferase n=1 Tax=Rhizophagus irregularis TaxID=588596 RepID=A0A2N0RZ04_9GLOM|nr:S-adenosyl-L-methionine-dependent methyltransferase [Rhizophagus irregularis]
MGNINSYLKHKRSTIKNIPEFDRIESEQERQDKLLNYYLSTDVDSIDRLHMYHFFKRYIFQSNFSSPIEDKLIKGECKVLDIGCGAGTWLLDLANEYENSYFFGVDIKPIFPQEIKPNNLEFIEADITNRLPFHDNAFDFAHVEGMSLIFTPDQWDFILSELIRVTKPGGYIEVAGRRNGHVGDGPVFRKMYDAIWAFRSKRNIDTDLIYNLDSKFELQPNIGKVHRIEKDVIMGPNGGKIGLVIQDISISYFTSEMTIKNLSEVIGISEEEFKNIIEKDLFEEFKQTSPRIFHVRFWAQKQLS